MPLIPWEQPWECWPISSGDLCPKTHWSDGIKIQVNPHRQPGLHLSFHRSVLNFQTHHLVFFFSQYSTFFFLKLQFKTCWKETFKSKGTWSSLGEITSAGSLAALYKRNFCLFLMNFSRGEGMAKIRSPVTCYKKSTWMPSLILKGCWAHSWCFTAQLQHSWAMRFVWFLWKIIM